MFGGVNVDMWGKGSVVACFKIMIELPNYLLHISGILIDEKVDYYCIDAAPILTVAILVVW